MDKLGIRWTQNALAILTGQHEGRSPCMNYGYCQWGCKSRAKSSMHVTYAPKAVLAGAEIRTGARAVQLEADSRTADITGVVYVKDGAHHRQEADVYVLSAFCIENPRLLLHSATPGHPDGLANSSGIVGRYLLAHVADSHFGRFEQSIHQWSTAPGTLLSQEHYGTQAGRDFVGGWSWMTSSLFPAEFGITLARAGDGWWGERLVQELYAYPHYAVLGTEGDCQPSAENKVELSSEVDEYGVPRLRVTFSYGENEQAMRREIHRLATDILDAAGATKIVISTGNDHTMGGCRMGADPANSVVDRDLRSWDHPNLYVCDASVFVTSGGAQPSQTIMALASRLAVHLQRSATHELTPSRLTTQGIAGDTMNSAPFEAAKRPRSVLAGPYAHPFHPMLVTVPIGAWVASILFDVGAAASDDEAVFAAGAYWLIVLGILGALVAAAFGLLDLLSIPRGTRAFKIGLTHMGLNLLVIGLFLVGVFVRAADGQEEFSVVGTVVSVVALALLGASGWLGGELAYRYGVRVATEETQREGFR